MLVTLAYESRATVEVDVPDEQRWDDKALTAAALEAVESHDWITELAWVEDKRPLDPAAEFSAPSTDRRSTLI